MSFEIKQATRQGIKPLIVYYSESGCGKTYSALLTARGMVGPKGRICVVDTESGRASLYADLPIFGKYDTLKLEAPFSPARYIEAMDCVVSAGYDIVIVDSGSHEWDGVGGVLDHNAELENKGRPGLHNWQAPKFEHAKFVQWLMRSPIHIIVCLRAKYKSRQLQGTLEMFQSGEIQQKQIGKTIVLKDKCTSPIQAEDFIFEATCHGEIMPDHSLRLTKSSHPSLKSCFPDNKPIELKHGEMIARWCAGESTSNPVSKPVEKVDDELQALRDELKSLKSFPTNRERQQWLIDEAFIDPDWTLPGLTVDQLKAVIKNVRTKLKI